MDLSPVLDKVRKLLRLAQSSNENEAAAAMGAAQRLIDEHRLSVAELEASGQEPSEPMVEAGEVLMEGSRVATWKVRLMLALVKANGCSMWFSRPRYTRVTTYQFVGRKSDVESVKYLLAYALNELGRLAEAQCRGMGRSAFASWYLGAVAGIREKLEAAKQEVRATASTSALAVIDKRQGEAQAFREALTNGTKTVAVRSSISDACAYNRGLEAGRSLNLGRPGLTGGSAKALTS
ncbi:MAG: DUF2786 domain-containing protein [bacterium]